MIVGSYGNIGSKRDAKGYRCPHCGRYEQTRKLFREHIEAAHPPMKPVLTHGERAVLSGRAKKIKVTLAGKGKP